MVLQRNECELIRYAIEMNHVLDTRQLILNGFELESRGHVFEPGASATTLLCYAASCHAMDTVLTLIALGVNINAPTVLGHTPVHMAISCMKTPYMNTHQTRSIDVTEAMVRLLIYYGADICASNCEGETPLHLAARMGVPSVVRILLNHGAQVSSLCKNRLSPVDVCETEIRKLMCIDTHVRHFGVLWSRGSCDEPMRRYQIIGKLLGSAMSQVLKFQNACAAELMKIRQTNRTENDTIEDLRNIFEKLYPQFNSPDLLKVTPQEMFERLIHQGYLNAAPDIPRIYSERLSTPL